MPKSTKKPMRAPFLGRAVADGFVGATLTPAKGPEVSKSLNDCRYLADLVCFVLGGSAWYM